MDACIVSDRTPSTRRFASHFAPPPPSPPPPSHHLQIALKLLRKVNDNYISLESAFIMSLVKVFIELAHETTDGPTTCVTIVKGAEGEAKRGA